MSNFEQIDVHRAKQIIEQDVLLVDIRDPHSYNEAHIPKAIRVDQSNVANFLEKEDKEKVLLCYCYHGISSQQAAAFFSNQGFKQVYSMMGGFEEWKSVYPTTVEGS